MTDLVWQNVEVASLSQERQAQYKAMKDIYRQYTIAKKAFEEGVNEDFADNLGADSELKFGYRFGKLSVAIAPREHKASKPSAPTQSLAAFLQGQGNAGRRA